MMKTLHKINLILVLFIASILSGCALLSKLTTSPYEGRWSYVLDTPEGVYKGFITIIKDGKTYTGTIEAEQGIVDLRDLKIEDGKLFAVFDAEGFTFDLNGKFDGDVLTADISTPDFSLPFTANKVKE